MASSTPAAQHYMEGALEVIKIAPDGNSFTLQEDVLAFVLGQIEEDLPVAIVSVVGAFRTGKSFMLDLFLRYLRRHEAELKAGREPEEFDPRAADGRAEWLYQGGVLEGNALSGVTQVEGTAPPQQAGFKWRGGEKRCTLGIWIWTRPFVIRRPGTNERMAVLLLDTQGLFDNETSQMLTACIFGLSTLMSSYTIYNMPLRVQEDGLQHVALFSEYARIAAAAQAKGSGKGRGEKKQAGAGAGAGAGSAAAAVAPAPSIGAAVDREESLRMLAAASAAEAARAGGAASLAPAAASSRADHPPFQRLEFLVRDSGSIAQVARDADASLAQMRTYINGVFQQAGNKDLRAVRAQILECFRHVSCYSLVHPGATVAEEPQFTGDIDQIRDLFRLQVERYCHLVFEQQVEAKVSPTGRELRAVDLARYIPQFVKLFQDGGHFPAAQVLLTATAEANNRAAKDAALSRWGRDVARLTNHRKTYMEEEAFAREEGQARRMALVQFDLKADFGPEEDIRRFRSELSSELDMLGKEEIEANKARSPWRMWAPYLYAGGTLIFFYFFRVLLDVTCSPWADVCKRASNMSSFVTSTIFLGFIVMLFQTGAVTWSKIQAVMTAATTAVNSGGSAAEVIQQAVTAAAAASVTDAAAVGRGRGSAGAARAGSAAGSGTAEAASASAGGQATGGAGRGAGAAAEDDDDPAGGADADDAAGGVGAGLAAGTSPRSAQAVRRRKLAS